MRGKIDFKGTKEGIVLLIKGDLTFEWIQILVQKKLKLARHFFEGAHIIGSSGYMFSEEQESILSQLIQAQSGMKVLNLEPYDFTRDIQPKSVDLYSEPLKPILHRRVVKEDVQVPLEVRDEEQEVLLADDPVEENVVDATEEQAPKDDEVESFTYGTTKVSDDVTETVSDTLFHRGTLRSGRRVVSAGNIVVLGDVNPGAELIARGNIIVMGNLRGLAHAGSDGNEKAFVAAIRLMPTQLRIDKIISRPPDEGHEDAHYPEIAYVQEGHMIIEPYL